jgi:hypothetical protein
LRSEDQRCCHLLVVQSSTVVTTQPPLVIHFNSKSGEATPSPKSLLGEQSKLCSWSRAISQATVPQRHLSIDCWQRGSKAVN